MMDRQVSRRSLVKFLSIGAPVAVIGGSAIASAAIGVAVVRPPKPLAPVQSNTPLSVEFFNELIAAVNHANGFDAAAKTALEATEADRVQQDRAWAAYEKHRAEYQDRKGLLTA